MEANGRDLQMDVVQPFQAVFADNDLFEKMVEFFPYPVQIFSPDGTAVMINKATVEMLGIRKEAHVGHYNVFRDPLVREQGFMDKVRQVLTGKIVHLNDLNAPYQDMIKYFNVEDRDIKTLHVDITCFPLMESDHTLGGFVAVFIVNKIYRFRDEIQKGREYIENHWREKYDAGKVAQAANLSQNYFARLFKKHMGTTPHDYYIKIKISKIQEYLRDPTLTVSEAFAASGVDYHGHFSRVFKKKVGLSPSQYRKTPYPKQP